METSFKKSQADKYVNVEYITNIPNLPYQLKDRTNQWCITDEDADKFISTVRKLEGLMSHELSEQKLNHNVSLIILTYINAIENISSGMDVRSKLPLDVLAKRFVESYVTKYDEAVKFCTETKRHAIEHSEDETYPQNWRRYDKHNEYVKVYMLDENLSITDSDFKVSLSSMNRDLGDILEKLKALNL